MTVPQRIQIKFFATDGLELDPTVVIPVFHKWIQNKTVSGLLIDVADYKHVPEGPGILLVGHDVEYGLDYGEGKLGLLHTRKIARVAEEATLATHLKAAVDAAQEAVIALEDADLGLRFDRSTIEIRLLDRLVAPNSAETFQALQPTIEATLGEIFGAAPSVSRVENDARRPLMVTAQLTPETA